MLLRMETLAGAMFGFCVVATLAEAGVAWRKQRRIYERAELGADLRCAVVGFGVLALHRGMFLGLYAAVHHAFGAAWFGWHGVLGWLACFLIYDFVYYVDHRTTHGVGLLWASHQVHHQTRAFHLLTGLRMSAFGPLFGYPFRLPLALLGVPPALYVSVDVIHALWTYFLHARFVPELGRIGWVFNTPAHHRVHHSAEPRHFGRNYGGVLLVWDRLFKSYAAPEPVSAFGDGESRQALGPWHAHAELWRVFLRNLALFRGVVPWVAPSEQHGNSQRNFG